MTKRILTLIYAALLFTAVCQSHGASIPPPPDTDFTQ